MPQAPINYYPCNGGQNQRFWLDTTLDSQHPRILADASGLCMDVLNGDGVTGEPVRQMPCGSGTNQRFAFTQWPGNPVLAPLYSRVSPLSAPAMCVSVHAWSRADVRPTEQRPCTLPKGDYDQRWAFRTAD